MRRAGHSPSSLHLNTSTSPRKRRRIGPRQHRLLEMYGYLEALWRAFSANGQHLQPETSTSDHSMFGGTDCSNETPSEMWVYSHRRNTNLAPISIGTPNNLMHNACFCQPCSTSRRHPPKAFFTLAVVDYQPSRLVSGGTQDSDQSGSMFAHSELTHRQPDAVLWSAIF